MSTKGLTIVAVILFITVGVVLFRDALFPGPRPDPEAVALASVIPLQIEPQRLPDQYETIREYKSYDPRLVVFARESANLALGMTEDQVKQVMGDEIDNHMLGRTMMFNYEEDLTVSYIDNKAARIFVLDMDKKMSRTISLLSDISIGSTREEVIAVYGDPSNKRNDAYHSNIYNYVITRDSHGLRSIKTWNNGDLPFDYLSLDFLFNSDGQVFMISISSKEFVEKSMS